jgi:uncharacterized peroxidase-related enzyme
VDRFVVDWRTAGVDETTLALLEYADLLTRRPGAAGGTDIERLRAAGWSDRAISDAVQVCSYFNYINRIADGLGVDPEEWLGADGRPVDV